MTTRILCLLLALAALCALGLPVLAAPGDSGFSDVPPGAWYTEAADYVRENGLMSGTTSTAFSPDSPATRATLATILYRRAGSPAAQPYTTADLNYSDSTSRSSREQNDPAARPALGGSTLDLKGYDRVYLGYPLWFGQAPKIISTFLEGYDFSGKIIIPFCTSGSSGMGSSADNLHRLASDATWLSGRRFDRNVSDATVTSWADRLFQQTDSSSTPPPTPTPDQEEEPSMPILTIQVGSSSFTATLEDSETTRAFVATLPMTVTMGELNGNEKFYYLPTRLPTSSYSPGTIQNGNLMLYGSDCLVLFYETFSSGYSYTRLGCLDDPSGLAAALGGGSVEVTFLANK